MIILNKKTAELYGIILGDGCISSYLNGDRKITEIRIDGNSLTDKRYYKYLQNLVYNITEREVKIKFRKKVNGLYLRFKNKELIKLFKEELNFPIGKKGNISITSKIINNDKLLKETLRGFFDTDGCIYFTKNNSKKRDYPIIELSTHSAALIEQLKDVLIQKGFNPKVSFYQDSVKLHGKKNVIKWMQEIGSNNPYKKNRFDKWFKSKQKLCSKPF